MMMPLTKNTNGIPLRTLFADLVDPVSYGEQYVSNINIDSRQIQPDGLFLACHGDHTDGSRYITDAIDRGASVIAIEADQYKPEQNFPVTVIPVENLRLQAGTIADRFYDHPSRRLNVIGITGTNGKTSTAYYLAQVLTSIRGVEIGMIGTIGHGPFNCLSPGINTTPDAITIHRLFSQMLQANINTAIMEVSSHGLVQGRARGIEFNTGVFTNLSRDHLDYHGNMQQYALAKRQLFYSEGMKNAVINSDDDYGRKLIEELDKHLPVYSYGLKSNKGTDKFGKEKVSAVIHENEINKLGLEISSPWGEGYLTTRLSGNFNAYNLLSCLTVLCLMEYPFDLVMKEMSGITNVPGRMESFSTAGSPSVLVDYAHTPDALEQALKALRKQCQGKLVCVFGCGGERDQGKRPQMGRIAQNNSDKVILTSDNPRGEDPGAIIDDILSGMDRLANLEVQPDRSAAISTAISSASAEDVILIAGKGHETYQEISGVRYPYSDRQLVRNLLGISR